MSSKNTIEAQAFLPSRTWGFYLSIAGLMILSFSTVFLPRNLFLELSSEDGFFESLGAIFFLITSIPFFVLFFQHGRLGNPIDHATFNTKGKRYFFLLMAFLFFVMMGEEISWGQRILHFSTPKALADVNKQGEFNLHNMPGLHHYVEGKKVKTGWQALFTAKKLFVFAFVSYLFVLPLMNKITWVQALLKRFYIPVPLIYLGILFLFNSFIFRTFKAFYGYSKIGRSLSEIEEFNMAIILLFLPLVWFSFSKVKNRPTA